MRNLEADEQARAELARDHRDASRHAEHEPPAAPMRARDWKGPDAEPTETAALHLVCAPAAPDSVRTDSGSADLPEPPRPAPRRLRTVPVLASEVDPNSPMTPGEVTSIAQRARFNKPISRIEIRRLCATIWSQRAALERSQA